MADDLLPGVQWHLDHGGHNGRLAGHALRLLNEMIELCVAAGARPEEIMGRIFGELDKASNRGEFSIDGKPSDKLFEEMADVQILLNVLAYHAGCRGNENEVLSKFMILADGMTTDEAKTALVHELDRSGLHAHCKEKLKILYQRKWTVDNDGVLWRPKEVE